MNIPSFLRLDSYVGPNTTFFSSSVQQTTTPTFLKMAKAQSKCTERKCLAPLLVRGTGVRNAMEKCIADGVHLLYLLCAVEFVPFKETFFLRRAELHFRVTRQVPWKNIKFVRSVGSFNHSPWTWREVCEKGGSITRCSCKNRMRCELWSLSRIMQMVIITNDIYDLFLGTAH